MFSKKILTTLALVAAVLCGQATALAQSPAAQKQEPPAGGPPKPFVLPKKEAFTLKNGIVVTLVPYGIIPKVAVSAYVRAGNINETESQTWLADLTGDMLKEGTTTRTAAQVAEEAARMGGQLGIGVGVDQTSAGGDVLSEF